MPSFSTAKSAFVSLALMRLAQKYGPQVASQLVKDYVPEAADSPGDWSQVTFDNILDMATGNFRTSAFMVDEEGRIFDEFFGVETYADKIRIAFDWPNSAKPGTTWVYRSSDTFIAVAALQNYLRSQEGETADLFDFVVREVYQPIGLGQGGFSTLRTSENNIAPINRQSIRPNDLRGCKPPGYPNKPVTCSRQNGISDISPAFQFCPRLL